MTANAVNSQGIVVGDYQPYCVTSSCTPVTSGAWMYQQSSGALDQLALDPSDTGGGANGISDSGIIVGSETNSDGLQAAYWTVTGGAVALGQGCMCWAVAATDGGTIFGDYADSGSPGSAALMWTPPGYAQTVLPGLECDYCARLEISLNGANNAGMAVGSSLSSVYVNGESVSGGLLAVEWQNGGSATSLGSLENSGNSAAYGINSSGYVVGSSVVGQASGAPSHAFLYSNGTMTDLGTLSGDTNSSAASINDAGQIVGSSDNGNTTRPFLYENGHMYDLNSLVDPNDPLVGLVSLEGAVSISSNGYIAVNGKDSRDSGQNAGAQRAFLLVPSS